MIGLGLGTSLTVGGSPRVGFDFGAGALPPGASLTRASIGSRFDAAGVLRIEPADTARFDHDPGTGRLRGLLIEPERTNEVLSSAALDDAVWSPNSAITVAGNTASAPDGTMTADTVTDADATRRGVIGQALGASAARSISVFVAKDAIGLAERFVLLRGDSATLGQVSLDTATGEHFIEAGAMGAEVEECGGFWRLSFECSGSEIEFFPARGSSSEWFESAEATGSAIVWGFQAEQGSGATSYIPTGAGPATRAADVLTLDWARLGVPDGPLGVRVVFDDGSTQDSDLDVTDGRAVLPTTLARARVRRIERR
jgi:hypothetical protein